MKASYLLLTFCIITLSASASSNTIASLLQSYNVSSATIKSLSSVNLTYQGNSYSELFLNSNPYLLVNTTNPRSYAFVFNPGAIAGIIRNNTIQASIGNLGLSSIASVMSSYLNSSAAPLNDCLAETGLDRATCSLGNYCQSCALVPSCNKVLYATGGPDDTFGLGIIALQQEYGQLAQNISIFYNGTKSVSVATVLSDVGKVNFAFNNISTITNNIYQNAVFPPPTTADLSQCNAIGSATLNTSLAGAPWFCNAIGFCEFLTYNYTQLAALQLQINNMNNNVPTSTTISTIAHNINVTENNLVTPLLLSKKNAQLSVILNTTLANYTSVVNKTSVLLSRLSNASLMNSLATLEQDYATLRSGYLSLNLTTYSAVVAASLSNVSSAYARQEPLYLKVQSMADNNTGFLIALQSVSNNPNASTLAFKQDQLNQQISSHINNAAAVTKNLSSIYAEGKALESIRISPADISRATDGPFATAVARAIDLPYYSAVGAMPLFASIPAIIIGLVILAVIYGIYYGLKKENRIRANRRTANAWRLLFAIAIVIFLIYVGISYVYSSQANSNAPIQDFLNAGIASTSQGIVLNGTVTPGMTRCANILYNESLKVNRNTVVAYVSGNKCTVNGTLETSSSCLNSFVDSGTPFIVLTTGNSSSMHVYSMYGTALYATGPDSFMDECYSVYLLR